jgi:adenosylmethionine-8-amino-7-oxononanoate aminotransferase
MSRVFHRNSRSTPPVATSGEGCYLTDETGKRYLDGSGGAAVSCLGHGDKDIIEAVKAQMDSLAFAHTRYFSSKPAEDLADLLVDHAPEGIRHVYFVSGGSEAIETALKLARQYAVETGQSSRHHIIGRRESYHGNTLGALAVGGSVGRREVYEPLLIRTSHIDPCYAYRGMADDETPEAYGLRMADQLDAEIIRIGAENVLAFIAEPVVGASLGAVPAEAGYFRRIREICDQHGVLLIFDEVMCGMGRTGTFFAAEAEGVSPDIVAIAKGLGGGYQPIGAMLCQGKIFDAIRDGSGAFQHGHTYIGHPAACAAGLAVTRKLTAPGMMQQVRDRGASLSAALHDRFGQHPHIGDIRGRGLFQGMEFVADRESKKTFDPALGFYQRFKQAAFDAGLICYPMGGTTGHEGDHVLLAPPFIISEDQIGEMVDKLDTALTAVSSAI